jgi:hypothetical protein
VSKVIAFIDWSWLVLRSIPMEILDRLRIKQFGKNQTLAQMHRVVKQCVYFSGSEQQLPVTGRKEKRTTQADLH